jgi:hypothetical protein
MERRRRNDLHNLDVYRCSLQLYRKIRCIIAQFPHGEGRASKPNAPFISKRPIQYRRRGGIKQCIYESGNPRAVIVFRRPSTVDRDRDRDRRGRPHVKSVTEPFCRDRTSSTSSESNFLMNANLIPWSSLRRLLLCPINKVSAPDQSNLILMVWRGSPACEKPQLRLAACREIARW